MIQMTLKLIWLLVKECFAKCVFIQTATLCCLTFQVDFLHLIWGRFYHKTFRALFSEKAAGCLSQFMEQDICHQTAFMHYFHPEEHLLSPHLWVPQVIYWSERKLNS